MLHCKIENLTDCVGKIHQFFMMNMQTVTLKLWCMKIWSLNNNLTECATILMKCCVEISWMFWKQQIDLKALALIIEASCKNSENMSMKLKRCIFKNRLALIKILQCKAFQNAFCSHLKNQHIKSKNSGCFKRNFY